MKDYLSDTSIPVQCRVDIADAALEYANLAIAYRVAEMQFNKNLENGPYSPECKESEQAYYDAIENKNYAEDTLRILIACTLSKYYEV